MSYDDFEMLKSLKGPILITGHTGFKGSWLTFLCKQIGLQVYGLSLPAETGSMYERLDLSGTNPEVYCDIRDSKKIFKAINEIEPAAIIHLAAQPLVLESYRSPVQTFETNVMGTANILDAATKIKSIKIVGVATTDKVYLNANLGNSFKEDSPLGGKDPYSASKVGAEQVVNAWQQISRLHNGPRIVCMRAGNVIGGGDFANDRLLPDLIRASFFNMPTEIRNPHSTRPWQHVLDPLRGYLLFIEASLSGNKTTALNFSPKEKSLSVSEIVDIFNSRFPTVNVKIKLDSDPAKEAMLLELDSTLATSQLQWNPKLTQQQAINQTIDWWTAFMNNADIVSHTKTEVENFLKTKSVLY